MRARDLPWSQVVPGLSRRVDPPGPYDYVGSDVSPTTAVSQRIPLPIVYGTAKAPMILIEKYTPVQVNGLDWNPAWWEPGHLYAVGEIVYSYGSLPVTFGGNYYRCVKYGVSSSGTGPEGTTGIIADFNTAWVFLAKADDLNSIPNVWQQFVGAFCEGDLAGVGSVWFDKQVTSATIVDDAYATDRIVVTLPVAERSLFDNVLKFGLGRPATSAPYVNVNPVRSGVAPFDFAPDYYQYFRTVVAYPEQTRGVSSGTEVELSSTAAEIMGAGLSFPQRTAADVNPGWIVYDLFTSDRRGAGLNASSLDSGIYTAGTSTFYSFCRAAGFELSMLIDTERPILDVLQVLMTATASTAYWSEGKLKIVPLWDQDITQDARGKFTTSWVAPSVAQFAFTADDLLGPIEVGRTQYVDTFNSVPVSYVERLQGYQQVTIEDQDLKDIVDRGALRRAPVVNVPVIFNSAWQASMLSRIYTQRALAVRNTFRFKVPWKYVALEPTDIVTITDPLVGLSGYAVRITMIEESDDGLTITAEDRNRAGVSTADPYSSFLDDTFDGRRGGYVPQQQQTTRTLNIQRIANINRFSAHRSTTQTLARKTLTKVEFDIKGFDHGTIFDTTNHRMTAPFDGTYLIEAAASLTGNLSGGFNNLLYAYVNKGTTGEILVVLDQQTTAAGAASTMFLRGSAHVDMHAGDLVEVWAYNGDEAADTSGDTSTRFSASLVQGTSELASTQMNTLGQSSQIVPMFGGMF